jgi:hypothetical protein
VTEKAKTTALGWIFYLAMGYNDNTRTIYGPSNRRTPMPYPFPPQLDRLVHEVLASGAYPSEDELLLEAVQVLRERDEAVAGIQEGLADLEAGRTRSLSEVDGELRWKYSIPHLAWPGKSYR